MFQCRLEGVLTRYLRDYGPGGVLLTRAEYDQDNTLVRSGHKYSWPSEYTV